MNRLIHITIAVLLFQVLNLCHTAIAQTLPVTSQLQMTPPYSVYFSDLLRPETDQVKLNLLLRDLQEPYVDVQLRLKVEGPGISLETAPWFNAPSITLESGIPQLLTSVELAPYFDAANLNFGGISRSKYEQQGGRLPEGLYRISFTVFDAVTGRQLSQSGQAIAWMALSEPPRLNLPFCDTEINLENGQQYIVFQWSPVGVSPNTYGELEYEFTLTEIRPEGRDPYEAMRTLPPVFQFTTSETSLVYDNDEPLLIPGMAYAWRIQARDVNGKERFREQGFSPVCMFRVAEEALPTASGVRAEAISSFQGRAYWDLIEEVEDYRVEYRSTDGSSGRWYGINEPQQSGGAIDGETNLTGLIPGKEYEVRIGSRRDGLVSSWSESVYFTTPEEQILACGDVPPSVPFGEFEPLNNASVGDIIAAGDVNLTLISFSGSNGVYSGWGTVKVNFLGNRIPVEFQDIKINKDYRMVEGSLHSVQSNIDDYIKDWRDHQDNEADSVSTDTGNNDSGDGSSSNGDSQTDGNNTGDEDGDASQGEDSTTDSGSENGESNHDPDNNTDETSGDEVSDSSDDYADNGGKEGSNSSDGENSEDDQTYFAGPKIWFATDNQEYDNNDIITLPYSSTDYHLAFELRNIPENTKLFKWVFLQNGTDYTETVKNHESNLKTFGVNLRDKNGDMQIIATYDDKKITVNLRIEKDEFSIDQLFAQDGEGDSDKRIAHQGETLYLIDPKDIKTSTNKVKYWINMKPNLAVNKYSQSDIAWSYIEQTKSKNLQQEFGVKRIERTLYEDRNKITTSVIAGYPQEQKNELSVDVKWVESKYESYNMVNKFKKFLDFFKVVNEASNIIETVAPCQTSFLENFDRNLTWKWLTFNGEDFNSRHILETKRFEFAIDAAKIASFGCKKGLGVSAFGYSFSIGELYFDLTAGANLSIRNDEIFYLENSTLKDDYTYSQGGIKVTGKGGIKGGVGTKGDDGNVSIGIYYDTNLELAGGGRIEYPYQGDTNEIAGVLYINPLTYNITATAKMGPYDKDFKYSDVLWNIQMKKMIIYNMETDTFRE